MQTIAGRLALSPSDLNDHLECPHLTTLALEVARGERSRPFVADEHAELLRRKGEQHERAYLERLRAEGRQIVEITLGEPWDFEAAGRRTAESATKRSEKGVVQRCEQDARAADLAPDTTIDATGLGPEVVTGRELLVVDGQ